jgi:hypothetical protein
VKTKRIGLRLDVAFACPDCPLSGEKPETQDDCQRRRKRSTNEISAHQSDEIQGYYFSKALTVDNITDKLRGNHSAKKALAQASGKQA